MKRPCEQPITEPEASPRYPWVDAALRAKDPNAFLLGLGETEFAALLVELKAMGSTPLTLSPLSDREGERLAASPVDAA